MLFKQHMVYVVQIAIFSLFLTQTQIKWLTLYLWHNDKHFQVHA